MPKDSEKKPSRVRVEVVEETKEETSAKEVASNNENEAESVVQKETSSAVPVQDAQKDEEVFDTKAPQGPKSDKIPFWVLFLAFLIGLILGAGLIGGVFYYRSHLDNISFLPKEEDKETESQIIQETPEPTEEPEADYTQYSVNILNGSGIKGEAGKVEELLTELKFKSIDTGNASSYDYTDTEISFKEELPESVFTDIEKVLSDYSLKKTDNLESSSEFDIVITVGQTKSE